MQVEYLVGGFWSILEWWRLAISIHVCVSPWIKCALTPLFQLFGIIWILLWQRRLHAKPLRYRMMPAMSFFFVRDLLAARLTKRTATGARALAVAT